MIAGFTQANPTNLRPFFSGERPCAAQVLLSRSKHTAVAHLHPTRKLNCRAGGADNCIDAAGILFFTFIGMEAPAVGAEEARNPAHLPAAIVGNTTVALLVYFFMALSLLLMVPAAEVGTPTVPVSAAEYRANAFTAAFSAAGELGWPARQPVCVWALA